MTSHAEAAKFALTPGEKNVLTYSFEMMIKDEFLSRKTEQA